ncbi:hypothetical protein TREMEDRAFT_45085 [Tremella mesenterica DSM 1558]|uniref:uncharacterized protein n=1 Tax=Tremella mesenterica (strain ATCC 24925 / CBS 8224 / DSM 1558 / NBRC 9311 / NRRL Y-6157 / RJB 2259-6 / UBC 559-6) TaxID=578456 RepID=UPI0003F49A4B|nr:uncharacterized protein TREMEDRAFT_45085 [Tremella mesenterica DSM 1558]EIW68134.1 hypothetical protein TREMEDRAFT_45085 [Tremella mesenterica DSM 1558]
MSLHSTLVSGLQDHFILTQLQTLVSGRMDPIVSENAVSPHAHTILGGSAFSQNLGDPTQSACSSNIVGSDKSNYWSPLLFYRYPNNTYQPMLGGARIYYFMKSPNVKPFPPGLRMITGSAVTRNASDPKSLGVMISCNHGLQTQYLPNATAHPNGCSAISLGIFFPSCGLASGDLDSPDHFSHMAWPLSYLGGKPFSDPNGATCPSSHPIKYPTIFYESNYYPTPQQKWRNDENILVLSHGDSVGGAYHADFHNGWDQNVLTQAIAQCGYGKGVGENLGACGPFKPTLSQPNSEACRYQNQIPDEDMGYWTPISKLPGCNGLWGAEQGPSKPACTSPAPNPSYVYPNVYFENLKYVTHIPLALPQIDDTQSLEGWTPALGAKGASRLVRWGSDGSDQSLLHVGTQAEIIAGRSSGTSAPAGSGNDLAAPVESSGTTNSTSVSATPVKEVSHESTTPTETCSTAGATSTKHLPKVCKKKNKPSKRELSNHLTRRRSRHLGH